MTTGFVWFQEPGYNTYYTGKLMDGHGIDTYDKPFIKGFNSSDFLLDPYPYSYYNSTYQRNHEIPKNYAGQHATEITTAKSLELLHTALENMNDRPFLLGISPIAPHSNIEPAKGDDSDLTMMAAPIPLPRHRHLFKNMKLSRTPNFNTANCTGVSRMADLINQNQTIINYQGHFYRQRLRALQGIDDLAGLSLHDDFDGMPMPITTSAVVSREHVALEFWGSAVLKNQYAKIGKFSIIHAMNARRHVGNPT
ncbi:hypothetical protein BBP40_010143 [Aspergillus hancockii]|nr:hypothetical protein BBP40_010143 [Aspergillus hancockii]